MCTWGLMCDIAVRGGTEAGPYINLAHAFIAQHL